MFENDIVQLALIIVAGIAAFFISIFLLRYLAKRIMSPEQYAQVKRQKVVWMLPLIIGLMVIFTISVVIKEYIGSDMAGIWRTVSSWYMLHGIGITIIALLAFILCKIVALIIPPAMHNYVKVRGKGRSAKEEVAKRSHILSNLIVHVCEAVIIILAVFMILSEMGINITPLLAGAGVVGIAISLGSQKLIGDLINGAFIMIEDYYSVGDVVKVADISGLVEEVNIRRTVLRDLDGIVHIIPNGEIKTASNYTRNWSRVNIDIPVSYNENLDKVIEVLNRVGKELANDKKFRSMIITPPQVLRVENFGESAIEIKMLGETKPMKQWDVTGALRKRIKEAFDQEHIEIPWPHMKVYFGGEPGKDGSSPLQNLPKSPSAGIGKKKSSLPPPMNSDEE